ncbi:MAG: ABC transporter permease, partial [Alphaproteobacteria bacterium]
GRVILGGDLALQTTMIELTGEQQAWLGERGAVSRTRDLNAMVTGTDNPTLLVSLRAVDEVWPLYGAAELDPPIALDEGLTANGALVDRGFLERMDLEIGDSFMMGEGTFRITAEILNEPDRASAPFQ